MHTLRNRKLPASLKANRPPVKTTPTRILTTREILLLVIDYNFFSVLFIDIISSASLQSEYVFINVFNHE